MPDLNVVAVIPTKPGSEELVREALSTLVAATREEAGCLSYDLYESQAAPGTFVTVERWVDQAALDAHMASPHLAATFATAGEHLAGAPAIHPLTSVVSG